ncbi:EndoS/ChiA family endoglycosidase [Devriesea agamarum]|uniref:EndoS/ChiA family endoglycosidase n=1 Tax=Devriesea agamarum TaxID=472569 RepID=UPI00071C9385|nr:hypothetical protein [Devriesea agamarum]
MSPSTSESSHFRPSRRALIAGASGAIAAAMAGAGLAIATPRPTRPANAELRAAAASPANAAAASTLNMGYFRTWEDKATNPDMPNRIGEIPAAIDVALVFPDGTPDNSAFWPTLKDTYVPTLHGRGTKVVQTTGIKALLDDKFANTDSGHKSLADHLMETIVLKSGLDGLDVDMEQDLTTAQIDKAAGVFGALSKYLGPKSGTGKFLLYDTNRDGTEPLFSQTASLYDYVLVQSYGRSVSSLQGTWETYAPRIAPSKYLIGFSYYEENGTRWNDVTLPFETSRAAKYASWQPTGLKKAGIFSYALDRDGIAEGDNTLRHTTYPWSKKLKERMVAAR